MAYQPVWRRNRGNSRVRSTDRRENSLSSEITVFANSHYVTPRPTLQQAVKHIGNELQDRLAEFNEAGKLLEAQRLQRAPSLTLK